MHVSRGFKRVGSGLSAALNLMVQLLQTNAPRTVDTNHFEWVHLYVAASFEPVSLFGLGGILFDSSGRALGFFSEKNSNELLRDLMKKNQKMAIFEAEGMAVLVCLEFFVFFILGAFCFFAELVSGRRLVVFTDNQAVHAYLIKCRSANEHLDLVL